MAFEHEDKIEEIEGQIKEEERKARVNY